MSKYGALRDYLAQSGRPSVTLSFEQLSELVAGGLPPSAYRHRAWWSNEAGGQHRQSVHGWMAAEYEVDHVDQSRPSGDLLAFRLVRTQTSAHLTPRTLGSVFRQARRVDGEGDT